MKNRIKFNLTRRTFLEVAGASVLYPLVLDCSDMPEEVFTVRFHDGRQKIDIYTFKDGRPRAVINDVWTMKPGPEQCDEMMSFSFEKLDDPRQFWGLSMTQIAPDEIIIDAVTYFRLCK